MQEILYTKHQLLRPQYQLAHSYPDCSLQLDLREREGEREGGREGEREGVREGEREGREGVEFGERGVETWLLIDCGKRKITLNI